MPAVNLPDELLVHILDNLGYRDLLACSQVCKSFNSIVIGTAALQYTIELAVTGKRDNSRNASLNSSKEKLEKLKRHQEAWKSLTWSREIKIPMSSGGLWELYGGVLAQNTEEGELQFYQLPSDLRDIEEKRWTLSSDFGFTVRDFAMDPGQDLLVLVETPSSSTDSDFPEHRIHFRTMSTGKSNPIASRPMVSIPQDQYDPHVSHSIQIFGDFVGVYFCPMMAYGNEIGLWNWKTGELQIHIHGSELASFTLLSDRWMLFAYADEDSQPCLSIVDFVNESSTRCAMEELSTGFGLDYPTLSGRDVYLQDIQLRADPGPLTDNRAGGYFSQDPKDFIIVLTTQLEVREHMRCVVQFIPAKLILDIAAHLPERHKKPPISCEYIDWDEWLTDETRMLVVSGEREPSAIWVCYVYGNKFIQGLPMKQEGNTGFEARLYDFNQLALKRDAQLSKCGAAVSGLTNHKPSTTPQDRPFDEDIETRLPYWRNTLTLKDAHGHCKAMCTEDSIVIVDQECREYRVLVF